MVAVRPPEVHDLSADGQPSVLHAEVLASHENRLCSLRDEEVMNIGRGLAKHQRVSLDDDPGLLIGHSATPLPPTVGVVTTHVGDYDYLGVNNIGGVEAAQQSHLDQCRVDGLVTEPQQGGRGQQLKVAW